MILHLLLACTPSTPSPPPVASVDADTTKSAIDALCKLLEGAGEDCKRETAGIHYGETSMTVRGELFPVESSLGIVRLRGTVQIDTPKGTYITRLRGFGSSKEEALRRGIHEWALVSGTAVADTFLDPEKRPALLAVEPTATDTTLSLGGVTVLRGWPMFQPKGVVEHRPLMKQLDSAFVDREPVGGINLEVVRQSGEVRVECWMQGKADEALCTAARASSWPSGEYELRLGYAVVAKP